MQLEFAMLADEVILTADNKLIIKGANVDNLRSPGYPAMHTSLAFVAMFAQDDSDRPEDVHELRIETENPLAEPWLPLIRGQIATPHSEDGHPGKSSAVLTLSMLLFPVSGRYVFHVYVDDALLRNLYLYALEVPQTQAPIVGDQDQGTSAESG